ncbi:MAG: aminodeoxychorismate/anthranilate synthase component II [Verrucomicrobia bacterium]|nr:aminodeoxychorismate/anthranilate synthase component II [Verrucomicrobiota bacterium]
MIGLVDNFDSFTYNIVDLFESLGEKVIVVTHHTPLKTCLDLQAEAWVLGPGPGGPLDTGVCQALLGHTPILGICLGHQLIAHVFGAKVQKTTPHHGKCSMLYHDEKGLFECLPQGFAVTRYHSLVVTDLPTCLQPTAWTKEGEIMSLRHRWQPIFGVQYHPDSIATEHGQEVISQFLKLIRKS